MIKELTLCNKLWFSNPYIFGFLRRKPLKFQTMTFVRSKNIGLKYQRFTTLCSKDIGIRKSEFVAKSQFLSLFVFTVKICNWKGSNKDISNILREPLEKIWMRYVTFEITPTVPLSYLHQFWILYYNQT